MSGCRFGEKSINSYPITYLSKGPDKSKLLWLSDARGRIMETKKLIEH